MKTKLTIPKRIRNHVNPLADRSEIHFEGFADAKPILVDIGAYRGEFSSQLVERFFDTHNFIVTEIRKPYAQYLRELFSSHSNVEVFDGDSAKNIKGILEQSIAQGVLVDYIFVNFPDPWFKEKHKKRRVINPSFLTELKAIISSETKLILQTDQKELFKETIEVVEQSSGFSITYFDKPLWGIQSYWERMKIKEGSAVYRACISTKK